ncbi:MAG: amidohydrolase family protein [Abditibacteriales bacterium]|nr:amidohydrolase family protein [Abditibacteriales bacterium]MDW8366942.1 amidohydrolase family protein [Abditibacteriales bacterium]
MRRNRGLMIWVLVFGFWVLSDGHSAHAQTLAVRAETVLTVSKGTLKNGVVLVRDGKIAAVGANVKIPKGAKVIQAKVVMPGLIDAHSYLGCYNETDEPIDALTPELRVCDAFDPQHPMLQRARRAGITTACIAPGNANVIAGQVSIIKLGATPQILWGNAGVKFSISTDATNPQRNPTSRAGLVELVRTALNGAKDGKAVSSTAQTDLMLGFPTALDERCRALRAVLNGQRRVCVHAPTADDVENALALMDEFKLKGCLLHANEAAEVCDLLKERKIPVVLGPLHFSDSEKTLKNAGKLANAGVKVAFCTDAPFSDPASLRLSAHLAVKYGMTPDAALRALTLNAAEILGIAHRVGSIEVGKDADLLLLSGEPLNLTSRVEAVIIDGKVFRQD